MRIVTQKTVPYFRRKLLLDIARLLSMTCPAAVNTGLNHKICAGISMAYYAFDTHKSVLSVLPYLCLSAMALGTLTVRRNLDMPYLLCDNCNWHCKYKKNKKYQFCHRRLLVTNIGTALTFRISLCSSPVFS